MVKYYFNHGEVNSANIGSSNPVTIGPITSDITIRVVYTAEPVAPSPSPLGILLILGLFYLLTRAK